MRTKSQVSCCVGSLDNRQLASRCSDWRRFSRITSRGTVNCPETRLRPMHSSRVHRVKTRHQSQFICLIVNAAINEYITCDINGVWQHDIASVNTKHQTAFNAGVRRLSQIKNIIRHRPRMLIIIDSVSSVNTNLKQNKLR
jgi:hypothetical protein